MRLGMMQPYFFPYVGYFSLIDATDLWVVFDTAQYIRRGWVNRNRVLSNGKSPWKYVRTPIVRSDVSASIRDIEIDSRQPWKRDVINSLDAYKLRRAPFYGEVIEFLEETLDVQTDNLSELLVHCLQACCDRLNMTLNARIFSKMDLPLPPMNAPGDWATETAKALGVDAYVNAPGGQSLFDESRFLRNGVQLQFLQPHLPTYPQGGDEFLPGLSIIDVMMWNSVEQCRQIISSFDLTSSNDRIAA